MNKRRSRCAPTLSAGVETLEGRSLLSGVAGGAGGALAHHAAEVAARPAHRAKTETTLAVSSGTLGQPITFTVTVRAAAASGAPQGTVDIVVDGNVIQALTLTPTTSKNGRFATSEATYTLAQTPGGGAYFFGKHLVSAEFLPEGRFVKSVAVKPFTVHQPAATVLSDGVKIATVVPGTGPQIQSGQTASVLYTGYLESTGQIFDDSVNDGGTPISFTLGGGQVIPGFDAGTAGMQVGETRLIEIPPAEGYGSTAVGAIPANSTLIFVVTLESIT